LWTILIAQWLNLSSGLIKVNPLPHKYLVYFCRRLLV
jgi:hypothetical protein